MRTYILLIIFFVGFTLFSQTRSDIQNYISISEVNAEVDFNTYTVYSSVLAKYNFNGTMSSEVYLMLQNMAEKANSKSLYSTLADMSFDGQKSVYDVLSGNTMLERFVFSATENARLVSISYPTRNSIEVVMALDLTNKNKRFDIINTLIKDTAPVEPYPLLTYFNAGKNYDSLVIDARGLGFNPSIFPTVSDKDGNVIYNLSFVNRNPVSEFGFITYTTNANTIEKDFNTLAQNPYYAVAWDVKGDTQGKIVIDNEDATIIMSSVSLKNALKAGKVIVIID